MRKKFLIVVLPLSLFFSLSVFYFLSQLTIFWLAVTVNLIIYLLLFWRMFLPRFDESFLFLGQVFIFVLIICFLPVFWSKNFLFFPVLIGLCFFLYLFLKDIYQLLYQPRLYQVYSLEKMAPLLNFVVILFLITELETAIFAYHLSKMFFLILLFLLFWLSFYYFALKRTKDIVVKTSVTFLILIEFYLALSFFPLTIHLNGLLMAAFFVIIVKIWQKEEQKFL